MNWTEAQTGVIEYDGKKNILVSAAAGSGKTAVLVERIIRRILDEKDPLSVDEILVLTFTNAAAAEMKSKISAAVEKRLRDDPTNKHLAAQTMKLGAADISTIHAFAKKILTNNIHKTNLPAGFSVMDDSESAILLGEALDDCLERYYARIDKLTSFSDLTLGHGGIKNDNNLRRIITDLRKFARTLASPENWLNRSVNMYKRAYKTGSISGTPWETAYADGIREMIDDCANMYRVMLDILEKAFPEGHRIIAFYADEAARFAELKDFDTIDEFLGKKSRMTFNKALTLTKAEKSDPCLAAANKSASEIRKMIKKLFNEHALLKYGGEEAVAKTISELWPRMRTLKNITLMLMRRYRRLKLKRGALDFGDLEHYLIELIMNRDGTPKELCAVLGGRYKEIYVDEYQDTNNIQDTIFRLLSGGRGNIFMVGDIKQSIYRFRAASPALFIEKYESYLGGGNGELRVLSDNFRSRESVIRPVNELFENIMYKKTAGIDYTESEKLKAGAEYPEPNDKDAYAAEIIMTDVMVRNAENDRLVTSPDKTELEAESIAARIARLVYDEKLPIYDRSLGTTRPVEFGDIAVLMRSTKSAAPVYEKVFREYGIPTVSETGGFLASVEIGTALAFLNIIDNPIQDIPLLTVMRSPIFGFTADELAEIRANCKGGSFYDAVREAKDDPKAADFLKTLDELRACSAYMGINELIYKICFELDYITIAEGMKGGAVRRANLELLLKTAADFESKGLSGLFEFMKYLDKTAERGELRQALAVGESGSAVLITTIHKSKGLEYPVVVLANTAHKSNDQSAIALNEKLGIGLPYVDVERRLRYASLPNTLIKHYNAKEENAEEMRLLYVGLTRAKEKLIISCTNGGQSKVWMNPIIALDGRVMRRQIEATTVFRDWIVFGFMNNINLENMRNLMVTDVSDARLSGNAPIKMTYIPIDRVKKTKSEKTEIKELARPEAAPVIDPEKLEQILDYKYPGEELTRIPLKLTVSELKNRLRENAVEEEWEYTPRLMSAADRTFHSADEGNAAEIGTITHFALQHIDPARTSTPEETEAQLRELAKRGVITENQLKSVRADRISALFESETGALIRNAAENGGLMREFKMLFPVKAAEIYKELENTTGGEAEIIIQGVADCVCVNGGEAVLIDYKTDRCGAEQAAEKAESYRVQIDCYTRGIEEILGVKVKKRIVYFLTPGAAVSI